jgi:hypothetical protein
MRTAFRPQGLAYLEWVTVHWERVQADVHKLVGA